MSTAILARRKMGKTAIMERLFNITFFKNDGVIPFYYEVKEIKMWVGDFCVDFFLTFEAPQTIAHRKKEFIVQMIDEFQFMNAMIYRDKGLGKLQDDLAGGYLGTAESKIAPLLVSGSWVGWLMKELSSMLPARFRNIFIKNMPENEALELLYNYSLFFDVPVTEETAFSLVAITEGNPFYISAVIRSNYPDKDLEKKLKALVKTDIINQGASNNRYRGVNDNIFDKVFRGVYEEDIRNSIPV